MFLRPYFQGSVHSCFEAPGNSSLETNVVGFNNEPVSI